MDSLTNIELYELFKNHRSLFQTKPNFDAVADEVIDKLELSKSSKSKVKEDLDKLFKEYKTIRKTIKNYLAQIEKSEYMKNRIPQAMVELLQQVT